jgi:hypothetical protein
VLFPLFKEKLENFVAKSFFSLQMFPFSCVSQFFFKENNETALSSLALQQRHLAKKRFKYD